MGIDCDSGGIGNHGTMTVSNSDISSNTATYDGGGIGNYEGTMTVNNSNIFNNNAILGGGIYNDYAGTISLGINRIIGNIATQGMDIYSDSETSQNAQFNWWGSNSDPSSRVVGNVDVTPWLVSNIIANVVVNQSSNSPVNVGDTGIFTITVTNNGSDTATNIDINDILPTGFTALIPTTGNYDGKDWIINTLTNGETATLIFTGHITAAMAGNNITNTATTTWTEFPSILKIPDASIYTNEADVILSQIVNSPVNVGDKVTYVVTASNNGPDTATNINITDIIPSGLVGATVTASDGTSYENGIWTIPNLAYLDSATLTITGIAGSTMVGTVTTNTATRTSQTEYNSQSPTTTSSVYTKIVNYTLDSYSYGSNSAWQYKVMIPFVITVTNNAAESINNVIVQTPLPVGMDFLSANLRSGNSYDYDPTTRILTWNLGTLTGKTTSTFEYTIINGIIGPHSITSTANGDGLIQSVTWNLTTPNAADVAVTQTSTNNSPNTGDIFYITVQATNNGPLAASGYKITDVLSPGLTLLSATPTVGSYSNGIWNIGTLTYNNGIGETETLTLKVQYNAPGTNSVYKSASSTFDWWSTNNGQTLKFGFLHTNIKLHYRFLFLWFE